MNKEFIGAPYDAAAIAQRLREKYSGAWLDRNYPYPYSRDRHPESRKVCLLLKSIQRGWRNNDDEFCLPSLTNTWIGKDGNQLYLLHAGVMGVPDRPPERMEQDSIGAYCIETGLLIQDPQTVAPEDLYPAVGWKSNSLLISEKGLRLIEEYETRFGVIDLPPFPWDKNAVGPPMTQNSSQKAWVKPLILLAALAIAFLLWILTMR